MSIVWTDDLATGVDAIDIQHKELFKRIDNLLDSCRLGKGRDELKNVIQFLSAPKIFLVPAEDTVIKVVSAHRSNTQTVSPTLSEKSYLTYSVS